MRNVSGPSMSSRIASAIVRLYIRLSPIERGKFRLRSFAASRFLVARSDRGLWFRISGVSGFEWKILDGVKAEQATERAFQRLVRPGSTVLDAGANIGYFALTASSLMGRSGEVHAFEPTPAVASRL